MTLTSHSPRWWAALGDAVGIGVPLFFTLSAYLITELLTREKSAKGELRVGAFYTRRILRIWPLYFLVLGGGFALSHLCSSERIPILALIAYTMFLGNWYASVHGYLPLGFGSLWSIAVEEQFYLIWPLVVRLGRTRLIGICVIAYLTSQIAIVTMSLMHTPIEPNIWTSTLLQLQYLALGAGISLILKFKLPSIHPVMRIALLIASGVVAWVGPYLTDPSTLSPKATSLGTPIEFALFGLAVALLFFAFIGAKELEACKPLRYLGKISYGLYLFHLPCIVLLGNIATRLYVGEHTSQVLVPFLALPISIALAATSYRFFESPFLRLKERFEVIKSRAVQ
jgi:Predicted acyltransferases